MKATPKAVEDPFGG